MCRTRFLAMLSLSALLVLGCPARWKVVFINGSEECMAAELSGALDGPRCTVTISPGCSRSARLEYANRLTVFNDRGARLFEREDLRVQERMGKHPYIYILLTATNAYAVRPEHRETWREHIGEITKSN